MKLKPFGQTELFLSPIGLGTVKFGRTTGVKYPKAFQLPTDNEIIYLLDHAKNLGVNVLDTAPAYGNSEERIGQLLPASQRKEWVLLTKVGETFENGVSSFNFTPEHTRASIHRSLLRLNTDYLDIVLVHSDGNDVYNIEHFGILDCLQALKQKGLIRSFGMSTKTIEGGKLALEHSDCAMVTYNPVAIEEYPVIEHAKKLNKGILIKKALASGHLNKFSHSNPVQHSLNFILKEPNVNSIILGTINPQHLKEACEVL